MNAFALIVVSATLGVDYGWHRGNDGEWEYVIQIEPALVQTLVNGQALVSQMPPELRGVRRFRIQIGEGDVPRDQLPVGGLLAGDHGADGMARGSPNGPSMAHPTLPTEPGSWGQRSFDWLRQDPIRLDPLENSFLNGSRGRGLETSAAGNRDFSRNAGREPWREATAANGLPASGFQNPGFSQPGLPQSPQNSPGFSQPSFGLPGDQDRFAVPAAAGFGPDPNPYDPRSRSGFAVGLDGSAPRVGLPASHSNSPGNAGWNAPSDPRFANDSARDFALPERPRLDFDTPDNSTGGRGLPGNLPHPPTERDGFPSRAPTVSLSQPDRNRLPGDLPPPADFRRTAGTNAGTTGSGTTGANSNKSRGAHAEITQHGTQRTAANAAAADKIWWPLTTTVLLLFGSIGGNVYLGWLAMDFYRRYRECAWELRTGN